MSDELQARIVLAALNVPEVTSRNGVITEQARLRDAGVAEWVVQAHGYLLRSLGEMSHDFTPEYMVRFDGAIPGIHARFEQHTAQSPAAAPAYRRMYFRFVYEFLAPFYEYLERVFAGENGVHILALYRLCKARVEREGRGQTRQDWNARSSRYDFFTDSPVHQAGWYGMEMGHHLLFASPSKWYCAGCRIGLLVVALRQTWSWVYKGQYQAECYSHLAGAFLTALEAEVRTSA